MAMDIDILEESFGKLAPKGDELMDVFYSQLFELAPEVKPLFAGADMEQQKQKLLSTLVLLVNSLRDLESIVPALHDLGAKHVTYGVEPEHYALVGQALLAAMKEVAGDAWEPAYGEAWAEAYGVVEQTMKAGAGVA